MLDKLRAQIEDDWRAIWFRAWSSRFMLIGCVSSVGIGVLPIFGFDMPLWLYAAATGVLYFAGWFSRAIKQKGL